MFTFNKDVMRLIQNKDWYLAQRFMLGAKICMKSHTKINALSSNSSFQGEDSYPERARKDSHLKQTTGTLRMNLLIRV